VHNGNMNIIYIWNVKKIMDMVVIMGKLWKEKIKLKK
jgi:hypothetical protein